MTVTVSTPIARRRDFEPDYVASAAFERWDERPPLGFIAVRNDDGQEELVTLERLDYDQAAQAYVGLARFGAADGPWSVLATVRVEDRPVYESGAAAFAARLGLLRLHHAWRPGCWQADCEAVPATVAVDLEWFACTEHPASLDPGEDFYDLRARQRRQAVARISNVGGHSFPTGGVHDPSSSPRASEGASDPGRTLGGLDGSNPVRRNQA